MTGISRLQNPYSDNNAVRDLSMLFGREYELRLIYDMLEKKQSVSVIGSRHSGKSSLLQYVGSSVLHQRLGYHLQHYIFVLLDLRDYFDRTPDDFFRIAYEQTVKQYQEVSAPDSSVQTWQDRFRKVLRDIHTSRLHVVLLLDAFDRVAQNEAFDFKFFSSLRSLATQQLVSYVTASVKRLVEICHSGVYDSPFFTIFHVCSLGPLTPEEARQLVVVPAERVACSFSNEEVTWILEQAGRHPFFLQVTSRFLFAEKCQQQHTSVDLNRLQESVYSELLPCFQDIIEKLPQTEQEEVIREARITSRATRKMAELSESALFRGYVHEHFGDTDITFKDIKEALDNLANTAFLETTKLTTTHYVTMRYEQALAGVPGKGTIVRDLLKAAFTRMSANGTRADSASEWRSYNILYYHYFRYNLQNEQTRARLGIRSRRQFYREQEKAIQLLLKEVYTLEKMALEGKKI
ncbi:MAG: ATP-binding protein [Ktedonobacteraceae bacterium]|nr:ATP-binding protein [Ktedonobacteraceae bacterium]MBV9020325.1 ATP-binding protein [Ktedonobacteraceae bacterium]